jgi:hypothetical protein
MTPLRLWIPDRLVLEPRGRAPPGQEERERGPQRNAGQSNGMDGPRCLPGIIRYGPHQSESGCQWPAHLRVFGVDVNQTRIEPSFASRFPAKRCRSGLCKAPALTRRQPTSLSSRFDMLTDDQTRIPSGDSISTSSVASFVLATALLKAFHPFHLIPSRIATGPWVICWEAYPGILTWTAASRTSQRGQSVQKIRCMCLPPQSRRDVSGGMALREHSMLHLCCRRSPCFEEARVIASRSL